MDIMYRYFSAFAPPLAIPFVTGLLIRRITSRGVTWGVTAGIAVGVALQSANLVLVQHYAGLMATNARVDFWLRSGWTSVSTMATVITVFLCMWAGTRRAAADPAERERVRTFFLDLARPFERDPDRRGTFHPFGIIGIILIVLGAVVAAVSLVVLIRYRDAAAFRLDLEVGVFLAALGAFLRAVSGKVRL